MKVEQWLSRAMTVLRNLVFLSPFWLSFVLALAVEYYQVAIKVLELSLLKIFKVWNKKKGPHSFAPGAKTVSFRAKLKFKGCY